LRRNKVLQSILNDQFLKIVKRLYAVILASASVFTPVVQSTICGQSNWLVAQDLLIVFGCMFLMTYFVHYCCQQLLICQCIVILQLYYHSVCVTC